MVCALRCVPAGCSRSYTEGGEIQAQRAAEPFLQLFFPPSHLVSHLHLTLLLIPTPILLQLISLFYLLPSPSATSYLHPQSTCYLHVHSTSSFIRYLLFHFPLGSAHFSYSSLSFWQWYHFIPLFLFMSFFLHLLSEIFWLSDFVS